MATRPLGGIGGNTGITGGIKGLNNQVPVAKTEVKKETPKGPADAMGSQVTSKTKLEGNLNGNAVQTNKTASAGALWGDTSPKGRAQEMVDVMTRIAKAAESGGDATGLIKQYARDFNGHDQATRDAVDVLWSKEGAPLRAQLEAATARIAKAAPNLEFPGYIADSEAASLKTDSRAKLLDTATNYTTSSMNRWQPKATKEQLVSMTDDQLRTFISDSVIATRTRRAETMPLEAAYVEAAAKGDQAGIKAAAQAIVALGEKGIADLGPMFDFYSKLASA